jgi:transcriptional regulator with XRE-family HTH domain
MTRYAKPEKLPTVIVRLAWKRKLAGLSRAALSRKLGYHQETLAQWERGIARPSFKSLQDWCSSLGMDLDAREIRE